VIKDRYGNDLSTNSQTAADHYIDAVDRFLAADSGVDATFQRAIDEDENFALAHLALARSHQMRGDQERIGPCLKKARDTAINVTLREAAQIDAIGRLLEGQAKPAYELIRGHLMEYPRDVMMAQTCMGVFGLIGEQLAFTTSLAPHYDGDWWFLSQHAFAQIESGQTARAEAGIEQSLSINPRSAQGAHIRAHLYYENGDSAAGFDYLADWQQEYPRDGLLHCHVAWHVALWALELGDEKMMWRRRRAQAMARGQRLRLGTLPGTWFGVCRCACRPSARTGRKPQCSRQNYCRGQRVGRRSRQHHRAGIPGHGNGKLGRRQRPPHIGDGRP
jgi:predicted Zn-dependent protease